MTTFDLTLLALAPVVLVLLTYPLLSDRASRRAGPDVTGDHADLVQPAAPTRAPPKLTGLPVRDLPEALRRSGGSQDIADSLLEQMLAELPSQTEDLAAAVAASDWPAARGLVHDIRCETALCAVPALHAAVCRLQAAARDVGVVATFTNSVGVATYPRPASANALPPGQTVRVLILVPDGEGEGEEVVWPKLTAEEFYAAVASAGSNGVSSS